MDELDLPRALRDLAAAPRIVDPAVHVDKVTTRVHHGRTVRTASLATASVVAILSFGAATWALAPFDAPLPPAGPTPTVAPSPSPEPEPSPSSTPDPTGAPAPDPEPDPDEVEQPVTEKRPLVGMTDAGDLVELDPTTGEVDRTVWTSPAATSSFQMAEISVGPDGATAYVEVDRTVWRVSLDDGAGELLDEGFDASVSPDGSTLAYFGHDPNGSVNSDGDLSYGLNLLALDSRQVRHLTDGAWGDLRDSRGQGSVSWPPDGTSMLVTRGFSSAMSLWSVPTDARTLDDGTELVPFPPDRTIVAAAALSDGRAALALQANSHAPSAESRRVVIVDSSTGEPTGQIGGADGQDVVALAGEEGGSLLVLMRPHTDPGESPESPTLYRWDGGDGLVLITSGLIGIAR